MLLKTSRVLQADIQPPRVALLEPVPARKAPADAREARKAHHSPFSVIKLDQMSGNAFSGSAFSLFTTELLLLSESPALHLLTMLFFVVVVPGVFP